MSLYQIDKINKIKKHFLLLIYFVVVLCLFSSCINNCIGQPTDSKQGNQDGDSETITAPTHPSNVDSEEGNHEVASEQPTIPRQSNRGSKKNPDANCSIVINVEPKDPLRNTSIRLDIKFKNNENYLKVDYIKCKLNSQFKAKHIEKDGSIKSRITPDGNIEISPFNVNKSEFKNYTYSIFVPPNIEANQNYKIIRDVDTDIQRHGISKIKKKFNDIINVQNNLPNIKKAEAHLFSNKLKEIDGKLFFLGNKSDIIKMEFNISANDVEDGDLIFICRKLAIFGSTNFIYNLTNETNCLNHFNLSLNDIINNGRYSFDVLVKDHDNSNSNRPIDLFFGNKSYPHIWTPDIPKSQLYASLISIAVTIGVTIIILNRFGSYKNKVFSFKKLVAYLIGTWILYGSIFPLEPKALIGSGYVFFNSVIFFELAIYISVFIIISCFIEACFSLDDASMPIISLISNSVIMIIILISLMWLFPKDPSVTRDLSFYYGTMAGIYGTVFALVVTLSGQIPKNIITIPAYIDSFHKKEILHRGKKILPPGEYLLYLKKLKYFVALYGTSLGLSLLGLILGGDMGYDILINGSFQDIVILLMSIGLFETTFLLIPPTIISMYHLMQVTSFRGRVTIRSKPPGAKICLSRSRRPLDTSSLGNLNKFMARFFPILKPESDQSRRGMFYLGLTTPCTLLLTQGEYRICLSHNNCRLDGPATINSINGIEKEYTFNLTHISLPIKSK